MRLKKYNKSIGMLSLIAATVLLSGCDMVLMNPKGAIGVEQRTLIITAIALMLIVVVPVIFMAFAFAGSIALPTKTPSTVRTGPTPTRSKRSSGPFLSLSSPSLAPLRKTTHELDPFKPIVTDKKPMTIEVVSLDWKWLFIYRNKALRPLMSWLSRKMFQSNSRSPLTR